MELCRADRPPGMVEAGFDGGFVVRHHHPGGTRIEVYRLPSPNG